MRNGEDMNLCYYPFADCKEDRRPVQSLDSGCQGRVDSDNEDESHMNNLRENQVISRYIERVEILGERKMTFLFFLFFFYSHSCATISIFITMEFPFPLCSTSPFIPIKTHTAFPMITDRADRVTCICNNNKVRNI